MPKSVRLKSFELVARDINDVDVSLLHALSLGVGWPHRPKDWDWLRHVGRGIVAVDGIGRVFGSAMWFPYGDDFATVGLVITTPRTQAQGNGRWLMDQVFEHCRGRSLSLNSTQAAYRLYLSLGFTQEATVYQYQGGVGPMIRELPEPNGELTEPSTAPVDEIIALDTRAFGTSRERLLKLLAEVSSIRTMRRDGQLVGFSMCREFGRGHVVGPVVASNDDDALQLTAVHLKGLTGRFARVDTREAGSLTGFLQESGLELSETVTTMSKGRKFLNRKDNEPWVYGLAGHAVG
ncbi:GCN5-related N-acetyltransferase protein [Rhizobium gallicum]|uniref:GCN5-related N-acetyltransferase protein n=1 Tax=Rhizobium gallicum TaxID=56730 RepID=A0A1L5NEK4_9HYPH|nr:GNAT family N-acetyltransferase [Rhizobium gallicum]APO66332.1 GCN5-related N-acetyltransferase protein [Rhizobium gallicum]